MKKFYPGASEKKSFNGVDGQTDDELQVIPIAHPEPCSGELKTRRSLKGMNAPATTNLALYIYHLTVFSHVGLHAQAQLVFLSWCRFPNMKSVRGVTELQTHEICYGIVIRQNYFINQRHVILAIIRV